MKAFNVFGWVLALAVGLYMWNSGPAEESAKNIPVSYEALTLSDYAELSRDDLKSAVAAVIAKYDPEAASQLETYVQCMGDFAANKYGTLLFEDVVGWCDNERKMKPEKFGAHFNELDAEDLNADAFVICTNIVRDKLASYADVDFPWLDFSAYRHGRNRYTIKSYVDVSGVQRLHFTCKIRYTGTGEKMDKRNWEVLDLELI